MINYPLLNNNLKTLVSSFKEAKPFSWLIIDNFLAPEYCEQLSAGFIQALANKDPNAPKKHCHVARKIGTSSLSLMSPLQQDFFNEVNGKQFVSLLEIITGITPVYPDHELAGGGLHEIHSGGYLNVHTDFNVHPKTRKLRALNLIVYLNKDWQPAYEGMLELWHPDLKTRLKQIEPIENRAVLFKTNEISFHGHPVPLKAPSGFTRRSLAVYYYTDWEKDLIPREKTNYQLTPTQKSALDEKVANFLDQGISKEEELIDALKNNYDRKNILQSLKKCRSEKK
jgi:2OG-Fe(II) oxygenase superfamily